MPADPATASAWFRKAAQAGHADAQFALAQLLDTGDGPVGPAARWYGRAAAQGHAQAAGHLHRLYAARRLVPPGYGQIVEAIELAAERLSQSNKGPVIG